MIQPILREPPDGGFGWVIVIAYALANLIKIPTITNFGLIFNDKFEEMNMPAADLTFIINLNAAFSMSLGFLNGPLLRTFGYRTISIVAAVFFTVGLTLTAYARSVVDFIITYGLITAVGCGLSSSSFALALNSYFRERRNRAAGIAMTLTGIGPIFYPPLIEYLLREYGVAGCTLLIAGLGLNMLVAAFLLQPVDWHLVSIVEHQEMMPMHKSSISQINIGMPTVQSTASMGRYDSFIWPAIPKANSRFDFSSEEEMARCAGKSSQLVLDHDIDAQSIYGFDQLVPVRSPAALLPDQTTISRNFSRRTLGQIRSVLPPKRTITSPTSLAASVVSPRKRTFSSDQLTSPAATVPAHAPNKLHWYDSGSVDSIHLGSSTEIFIEQAAAHNGTNRRRRSSILPPFRRQSLIMQIFKKSILSPSPENEVIDERDREVLASAKYDGPAIVRDEKPSIIDEIPAEEERASCCQSLGHWAIQFFDLDLIRDKIYVNIMLGISLALFSDLNFNVLTPFILSDLHYTNGEIATILSVIAAADLLSRLASPFVADHFSWSIRSTFVVSLILVIITRTGIFFATTYTQMLIVAVAIGIAKGVRTVYMSLVIPSYIPIERLASASGIQMFVNGILMVMLGPALGLIKDWSGSYVYCTLFLNVVSFTTVIMYTIESIYCHQDAEDNDADDVAAA